MRVPQHCRRSYFTTSAAQAARNFERALMPRSIGHQIGGWTDRMYSRYAIGVAEKIDRTMPLLSEHLREQGWH